MKLAIFDLGNVLFRIDSRKAITFLALRAGISPQMLRERISMGPEFEAFERGELPEARFFHWLGERLGLNLENEVYVQGWNAIYGPVIQPSYKAILTLSQHMPVVALTNTNPTHQRAWQTLYKQELDVFRKIYISSELGMRKPEKRIYRLVIEEWGVSPEETVFFDDLNENIEVAADIGVAAQWVTSDTIVTKWVEDYISERKLSRTGNPS